MKIFAVLIFSLFIAGCSSPNTTEKNGDSGPARAMKNFTFTETEGNTTKWVMNADSAVFSEEEGDDVILVKDVEVEFFDSGRTAAVMKAVKGKYSRNSQTIKLYGKVNIEYQAKKIVTSNVSWDPDRERFVTDEDVTIITEDGIIKGIGMEATVDLKEIKLLKNIEGESEY